MSSPEFNQLNSKQIRLSGSTNWKLCSENYEIHTWFIHKNRLYVVLFFIQSTLVWSTSYANYTLPSFHSFSCRHICCRDLRNDRHYNGYFLWTLRWTMNFNHENMITWTNAIFVWNISIVNGLQCSNLSLAVWHPLRKSLAPAKRCLVSWSPPNGTSTSFIWSLS